MTTRRKPGSGSTSSRHSKSRRYLPTLGAAHAATSKDKMVVPYLLTEARVNFQPHTTIEYTTDDPALSGWIPEGQVHHRALGRYWGTKLVMEGIDKESWVASQRRAQKLGQQNPKTGENTSDQTGAQHGEGKREKTIKVSRKGGLCWIAEDDREWL
ncbi:hypothetical protein CkaCkLH20_12243 [Colletotrichum karsti]|uniref:Uncharacterized protein n=1 Tax=Colletotrichum karsti TaxID=1095194 RepID=A0A9P6HU44_9PEZI|nr:uncharacterized protein CkaCkLH20_12243 [Colletotrichum karsti]KAF9870279.1 hypothetical protein CkaCkLH20_12243 [Colletotrichum karsti]